MILHITTLLVGPMFWPPFNQQTGITPTGMMTATTITINEGSTGALSLEAPGGPSLKLFATSRLNPINLIADQVSSHPGRALHLKRSQQ
jgi:hypothetical protein